MRRWGSGRPAALAAGAATVVARQALLVGESALVDLDSTGSLAYRPGHDEPPVPGADSTAGPAGQHPYGFW